MHVPADKEYEEGATRLKEDVIDHYMSNGYCVASIPVLVDGGEVLVDDFFMMPKMKVVKPPTKESKDDTELSDSITSIRGLFLKDSILTRKVCIIGEAGIGKTTLCQKIISSWCTIHTSGGTAIHSFGSNSNFEKDDIQFLESFKFLFYLPLRNHQTSNVIEMIKNDLIRKGLHDFLDKVLCKESNSCLVILDGLDEWMPGKSCTESLPYLDPREKFSVLIATRSWKLEVLRPKQLDIGQEIELVGLVDKSSFVKAIIKVLDDRQNHKEKKTCNSFVKHIALNKIENLIIVPLLLAKIICLWYDGKAGGYSQAEIYCDIIEYLFNVADRRQHKAYQTVKPDSHGPIGPCSLHPLHSFKDHAFCQKYGQILLRLSEMAYQTLFNENGENALIFPHSLSKIHNLTETDVQFCLTVGLLSQAKFCSKVTSLSKKVYFPHKQFQEFFAAMYMAYLDNTSYLSKLNTFKCLNMVLEMSQVFVFLGGMRPDLVGAMSRHVAELANNDKRVINARRSQFAATEYVDRLLKFSLKNLSNIAEIAEPVEKKLCIAGLQYINTRLNAKRTLSISYNFRLREVKLLISIQRLIFDCMKEGYKDEKFPDGLILNDVIFSRHGAFQMNLLRYINTSNIQSYFVTYDFLKDFDDISKDIDGEIHGQNIFVLILNNPSLKVHVEQFTRILKGCMSSLTGLHLKATLPYTILGHQCSLVETIDKLKHLTHIRLNGILLGHCYLESLAKFLSNSTQLVELSLTCIKCDNCTRRRKRCNCKIDLLRHESLDTLVLRNLECHIEVGQCTSLKFCELANVKIRRSVVRRLTSSSSLCHLTVHEGVSVQEDVSVQEGLPVEFPLVRLFNILAGSKSLKFLRLVSIDLSWSLLSFPELTNLQVLNLWEVTMPLKHIQCMVDSLPRTNKKLQIAMHKVKINCPVDENYIRIEYLCCMSIRERMSFLASENILTRLIINARIKSLFAAKKYISDKCLVTDISNDTSSLSCQFTCKPTL